MKANHLAVLLLPACLVLACPNVMAQAYKWRDAEGKLHFSATPPPTGKAEKLNIKPTLVEDPEALNRSQEMRTQQEESAFALEQAKQKKALAARQERQQAEQSCLEARRRLDILSRQRPIYRVDKDGQRQYMEDGDRTAEAQRAQALANRYCR